MHADSVVRQNQSWIFIIEGLMTFVVACAAPFMMADFPEQAKFLTPPEKTYVVARLRKNQGAGSDDVSRQKTDSHLNSLVRIELTLFRCIFPVFQVESPYRCLEGLPCLAILLDLCWRSRTPLFLSTLRTDYHRKSR